MESVVKALAPAERPGRMSIGRPIPLITNFFEFRHHANTCVSKFAVFFHPEIDPRFYRERERIIRRIRNDIQAVLGIFVFANTTI